MKNTKWIWRVFAVLAGLVVMAGIGFAGYRVGLVQGADLTAEELTTMFAHKRGFDGGMSQSENGMRGHEGRMGKGGFDRGHGGVFSGRGGHSPFGFLFGLFHLAVLGGLIWLGYRWIKNSGWKLVKTEAGSAPVQTVVDEAPSAGDGDEKKESA